MYDVDFIKETLVNAGHLALDYYLGLVLDIREGQRFDL